MKKILSVFALVAFLGVGANFASAANPSVMTKPATATATSITFNGIFTDNGTQTTTRFEYSTNQNDLPNGQGGSGSTSCQITQSLGATAVPFTCTLSVPAITAGTTYYVRAIAANSSGTDYGYATSISTNGNGNNNNNNGGGNSSGGCGILSLSSISPSSATAGTGAVNIVISGNTFDSSSVPRFNGSNRSILGSISPTQITMTLTPADITNAGNKSISIANGNCTSNEITFVVNGAGGSGNSGGGLLYPASSTTENAGNITSNSAILNGSVNPDGYATTAWFEYGTSSNLVTVSETTHITQGTASLASTLTQSLTNLTPNTTYYFRAVANNSYGTVKGTILNFTTGNLMNGAVTTVQATNQTNSSAKLNGIFINQSATPAQGYFEYGTTASLGSTTNTKDLGSYSSVNFSDTINNLTSGTIYYFRAVATNQGSTHKGNIVVFQTKSAGDTTTTNTGNDTTTSDVTTTQSSILKITTTTDNISVGNDIEYLVTFTNNNSANIENAKISIQLPKEVDFKESNFGKVNSDNIVELNAGLLVPNQVGSLTIKGNINSNGSDKNVLITTAVMTYNMTGSTSERDEIAFVTNHIVAGTGLEANSLFGTNFLPSTLLGWLALVLAILGLAVVGRKLFSSYLVKAPATTGNANHIDNLPL